ncbi:MAG: PilZ domain-containing protein [Alphaproteobacteria bacterium]|nr:PilZ domain-containing protein [Alphaproteobacteria bacterium]
MKKDSKTRFVSDVDLSTSDIKARKPFKVSSDDQRRFVRIEISSPMGMRRVKDIFGNFWPTENRYLIEGTILNISGGGVLVEIDQPLNEGDIVSMRFRLQEVEDLDNVLGLVKRSEQDEDIYLSGIEFITMPQLQDKLSQGELDLLDGNLNDFQGSVQNALEKYLYHDQDASRA